MGVGQPKGHVPIARPKDVGNPQRVPEDLCLVARGSRFKGLRIEGGAPLRLHREVQGDEAKTQGDGKKEEALSHGRLFFWARDGSGKAR